MSELEAQLEAMTMGGLPADWREMVARAAAGDVPGEIAASWRRLLLLEGNLACGDTSAAVESGLRDLASGNPATGLSAEQSLEAKRISSRAASALVRLRVASGSGLWDVLGWDSFGGLPPWEKLYLAGLVEWRSENPAAAERSFGSSLRENPPCNCVRLALAALVSRHSTTEALTWLEPARLSFDVLVSRAALLVRLGRHGEAAEALAEATAPAGSLREPLRFDNARARVDRERQSVLLLAGLAERQGRWAESRRWLAQSAWLSARPGRLEARLVFSIRQELGCAARGHSWLRDQAEQRLRRQVFSLARQALSGDDLFHRALARSGHEPDEALLDLQKLLQQPGWVAAQRRVGGSRLMVAGDTLLGLGSADGAAKAYDLAASVCSPAIERRSIAFLIAALVLPGEPALVSHAVENALAGRQTAGAWVAALGAVGLAVAGARDRALAMVGEARRLCGPAEACDFAEALAANPGQLGAGRMHPSRSSGGRSDLDTALRLLHGSEPVMGRATDFVVALGDRWLENCPTHAEIIARFHVAALGQQSRWDEAVAWVGNLERKGLPWARVLAGMVGVGHALSMAVAGQYDQAKDHLTRLAQRGK